MENSSSELHVMRMKMKMASASTITLFLLCCLLIASAESADECKVYGERGKSIKVPLGDSFHSIHKLEWSRAKTIILRKVENTFILGNEKDIDATGSLVLNDLKNQEGVYQAQVYETDGVLKYSSGEIRVCIQDPVKKPTLKMECVAPESVKFICIPAQGDKNQKTEWLKNNMPQKMTELFLLLKAKEVEKDSFSCKVSNQVSSNTSASLTQTCLERKTMAIPDEVFGISIWVFVGGGGGIVLLLIILVIFCCIRTKRKKRMRLNDAEELRLNLGSADQQQHHHQHPPHAHNHHRHPSNDYQNQHQQQQAAGHTGPRQNRSRNQRPKAPEPPRGDPNPAPRQAVRGPIPTNPVDDEQPPPLPQPRKKVPKAQRM